MYYMQGSSHWEVQGESLQLELDLKIYVILNLLHLKSLKHMNLNLTGIKKNGPW